MHANFVEQEFRGRPDHVGMRTNVRWRLSRISHSPFARVATIAWYSFGNWLREMTIFTSAVGNPAWLNAIYLTIA